MGIVGNGVAHTCLYYPGLTSVFSPGKLVRVSSDHNNFELRHHSTVSLSALVGLYFGKK